MLRVEPLVFDRVVLEMGGPYEVLQAEDRISICEGRPQHVDVLAGAIGLEWARAARWIDAGRVVISGGLSNGIAMALHLVDRLVSTGQAVRAARKLAYDWDPADDLVIAPAAPVQTT